MSGSSIPPVDPTKPRPIRKNLIDPVVTTGFGRWWLINVAPRLDPVFFKLSGGRFTSLPAPILFLTHAGARSGQKRETPLVYFTELALGQLSPRLAERFVAAIGATKLFRRAAESRGRAG